MTKLQSQGREPFEAVDRAPEAQADGFATVRQAHESEMAEDYVELIAELIETRGEARPVEIAERLGVKPPTVTTRPAGSVLAAPQTRSLAPLKLAPLDREDRMEKLSSFAPMPLAVRETRLQMSDSASAGGVKKAGPLLLGFYFAAWYVLNVAYNIYCKKVLNVCPLPWTFAVLQLGMGIWDTRP